MQTPINWSCSAAFCQKYVEQIVTHPSPRLEHNDTAQTRRAHAQPRTHTRAARSSSGIPHLHTSYPQHASPPHATASVAHAQQTHSQPAAANHIGPPFPSMLSYRYFPQNRSKITGFVNLPPCFLPVFIDGLDILTTCFFLLLARLPPHVRQRRKDRSDG